MSESFELVTDEKRETMLALLEERAVKQVAAGRTDTAAARKAAHRKTIETLDQAAFMDLQEEAVELIDLIFKNQVTPDDPELTDERIEALMREHLGRANLDALLKARAEMVREVLFAAITTKLREQGVKDPENTNGDLPAPALGKRFARQGCGRTTPHFDEEMLAQALGERWEQVCDVIEYGEYTPPPVPAHREYVFNLDKFFALARRDPALLDVGADCLIPGETKTPKLAVHNYYPAQEQT